MAMIDVYKNVYGSNQFGYSQNYINSVYNQQANQINRNAATGLKSSIANLNTRGLYSTRPVSGVISQSNATRQQSLNDAYSDIQQKSMEYGQQQQAGLFSASVQEETGKQQQAYTQENMATEQEYTLKNMSVQQQYDLEKMAQQYQYDKDLAKLKASLESNGWGSLLGTVVGTVAGSVTGSINWGTIWNAAKGIFEKKKDEE